MITLLFNCEDPLRYAPRWSLADLDRIARRWADAIDAEILAAVLDEIGDRIL